MIEQEPSEELLKLAAKVKAALDAADTRVTNWVGADQNY